MIPESFINELRYRCDAQQIIGSYVNLKRRGRNLLGLCPFHSEKTPSFTVYPENQSFYCFGCGAGGSVINFIMKIENLDYVEAVRFLAQKVGMEVPEGADDGYAAARTRILEMNRIAARYFHEMLMSDAGKHARGYLVDRGLQKQTVVHFGLGYSPPEWRALLEHLQGKGYTRQEIVSAGLALSGRNDSVYDAFRGRVIFPIIDLRGNVIAFGGRELDGKGPKYLNSGDTPVFKKSRNLFALNFAKNSKREGLILAEGYMDVISLHQAGFDNAVATLGTALTAEQARILAQYAAVVTLSYDSDEAGQKATRRATAIFEEAGVKTKVLSIPDAKDPDEYIKKFGPERFELLLKGSTSATEHEIAALRARYDTDTEEGRYAFLQEAVRLLAGLPSPIERDIYLGKIARDYAVDKEALKTQLASVMKRSRSAERRRERAGLRPYTAEPAAAQSDPVKARYPKYVRAEERLLAALLQDPARWKQAADRLPPERILSDVDRELYAELLTRLSAGRDTDMLTLSTALSPEAMTKLSAIRSEMERIPVDAAELDDSIKTLLEFGQQKTKTEINELEGDDLRAYIARTAEKKQGVN